MQNVRVRLASIHRISHVKVTAHVVTPEFRQRQNGSLISTYKLGPSRFIIKAVDFRPSTAFESDTLRQVADKWRLLRAGSLRVLSFLSGAQGELFPKQHDKYLQSKPGSVLSLQSSDLDQYCSTSTIPSNTIFDELLKDALNTNSSSSSGDNNESNTCSLCGRSKDDLPDGLDLSICPCMLKTDGHSATSTASFDTYDNVDNKQTADLKPSKRPTCHLCGKAFSQQGSLNRHLKNIHEEKKIPCQYCTMSFGQMFDLRVS
ncbi:hypothetical protein FGB62_58g125 [Gracilaria domingensis]|nr:hypothetical protein FGB62_58g125 [Gracilaria domingensis]